MKLLIAIVLSGLALTGCSRRPSDSLVGKWTTGAIDTEWGPAIIEYTFQEDFGMLWSMRSADPDDAEDADSPQKGRYELNGKNVLIFIGKPDDAIRGEIKNDVLLVREDDDSKPIEMHKMKD